MVKALFDKFIKRSGFDNHIIKCYRKVSSAAGGFVIVIYLKGGTNEAVKKQFRNRVKSVG
jgi:hypothetical protein